MDFPCLPEVRHQSRTTHDPAPPAACSHSLFSLSFLIYTRSGVCVRASSFCGPERRGKAGMRGHEPMPPARNAGCGGEVTHNEIGWPAGGCVTSLDTHHSRTLPGQTRALSISSNASSLSDPQRVSLQNEHPRPFIVFSDTHTCTHAHTLLLLSSLSSDHSFITITILTL